MVDGKYTAWSQQHSHETFEPIKARSYELPSISGSESVSVVRFLMRLSNSSSEIQHRIRSAVDWMKRSSIEGIRLEAVEISPVRERYHTITNDKIVVQDLKARPMWARYYEIDTNRPFLCNRDGIKVYNLADVKLERRTGYAWYGYWPEHLIKKEFPAWEARVAGN